MNKNVKLIMICFIDALGKFQKIYQTISTQLKYNKKNHFTLDNITVKLAKILIEHHHHHHHHQYSFNYGMTECRPKQAVKGTNAVPDSSGVNS